MTTPTPEQIAQALNDFLYEGMDADLPAGHGRFVVTNYDKFAELHQRSKVHESLYEQVYVEALKLGIIIGFGETGIVLATDDNFGVALRWQYKPE